MRKLYLLFLALFTFSQINFGQTILFTEDFDDPQYTISLGGEGNDGSADYFQTTDGGNIGISYSEYSGIYFFAGQDIDDDGWTGSASPSQLTWTEINITGYSALKFSGRFASAATDGIDASDYIHVEYQIDGAGWNNLIWFENDGTTFNTSFLEDVDFDGAGEGTQLNSTFTIFSKPLLATGTTLDLRITVAVDAEDEDFAIDIFKIFDGASTPSATTEEATNIYATSAQLNGTINDNGATTSVTFEWGTTSGSYSSVGDADPPSIGASIESTSVKKIITGLTTNTTYYYRVVAVNSEGTTYGIEKTFVPVDPPSMLISEVADPSNDYTARYVELHNLSGSDIDFSLQTWYLSRYANGGTTPQQVQLTGSISNDNHYVIAYNQLSFETAYGFTPNLVSGIITGNGNDTYVLYYNGDASTGTLVDIYGEIGIDGTGEAWEYTDGVAERNSSVTTSNTTWTATEWTITIPAATIDLAPLPVELTTFTATAISKGVMLNWSTATEVNNYGFEIERASSSTTPVKTEWETISFIEGHGNSNSPNDYSFIDNSMLFGEVSYRLKQIDIDGAFEYSDVVSVTSTNLAKYELYQNNPNPFNPSTIVSFTLPEITHVKITVYNSIGQKVTELLNKKMDAGYHKVEFDASDLSSGFYIYRLETPNYSRAMKMILLR